MFYDRIEAGIQLAQKLKKFSDDEGIVLAVPRGGVPVAYTVASALGFPLEIIFTKKIGHPFNKEYAIGAASLTDYFIIPHENISEDYIQEELQRVRARLKEMHAKFMGDREPVNLNGKTVIVIDDGIATGNTLMSTIQVLRKSKPRKIIIAVPVASRSAFQKLSKEVTEVIALLIPNRFDGVGAFYENFEPVTDDEVMMYIDKFRTLKKQDKEFKKVFH